MENKSNSVILVTGATGYISAHCIKLLLEQGYKVRGSVRSLSNKDKYQYLYDLVPEKKANLSFVEAELTDPRAWLKAVEGCDYILHVASPIPPYIPKDENEVIKPAVEGTINVLEGAVEKGVKKVVITSTCLAIWIGNEDKVITEDDWSDLSKCAHYPKSKILAERAAWEFYEKNKDKIDVTVVNPSLVLGPTLTRQGNASEALIAEIMKNSYPGIPTPDCGYAVCDVRDAAEAHIRALCNKDSKGKRYIVSGYNTTTEEIVNILKSEFDRYGYEFPTKKVTLQEIKESGNQVAQRALLIMGKTMKFNNQRSIKELGMKYHTIEETIKDMGYSLIKNGLVEDKTKGR